MDDHFQDSFQSLTFKFPRPKLVSVEFTMQCHAEDLISHDRGAMLGSDKVSTGVNWRAVSRADCGRVVLISPNGINTRV